MGWNYAPWSMSAVIDPDFDSEEDGRDPYEQTSFYTTSFTPGLSGEDQIHTTLSCGRRRRKTTSVDAPEVVSPPEDEPPGWADPAYGGAP